eukprot:4117858-Pyramimonas_sp.AAC.1
MLTPARCAASPKPATAGWGFFDERKDVMVPRRTTTNVTISQWIWTLPKDEGGSPRSVRCLPLHCEPLLSEVPLSLSPQFGRAQSVLCGEAAAG